APVTTDNAPGGWQNHDVTVTLSPTDSGPAGGVSGVDKTFYRVDSSRAYTVGTSVLIAAPSITHANDGTHTIDYYSSDKAGNLERSEERRVGKESVTRVRSAPGSKQVTNASPFTIPYTVSDESLSAALAK